MRMHACLHAVCIERPPERLPAPRRMRAGDGDERSGERLGFRGMQARQSASIVVRYTRDTCKQIDVQ
eukprot:1847841-Lingulodinium_polyedra.AAC.1